MRIAVTGRQGQLVSALIEVGPKLGVEVLPAGRPELDLLSPETVQPALANIRPNIIVNAAAYTAVDQAEKEPEAAMAVNAGSAMAVAKARPANSGLDCSKLERVHNMRLPSWRTSLMACLERLTSDFKQS